MQKKIKKFRLDVSKIRSANPIHTKKDQIQHKILKIFMNQEKKLSNCITIMVK